MIKTLKKIIGFSPMLKKLLLSFYANTQNVIYWVYKRLNLKFSYVLIDETDIKFYPKGQIAKGLFFGWFEKKELEIFQSLLTQGSVIIDAGANIGLYSIIGSRLVGEAGKIYSFEPSKENFNLLLKNIELNEVENIVPINMGLGDKIGETLILTQNLENGDAEKYILKSENKINKPDIGLKKTQLSEPIALDTLDNFLLKKNIKKVDFLKIDVEGYEHYIFKGAENLLKNNPEIIILFECADHFAKRAGSSQAEVFTFLKNLGIDIVFWNKKEQKWSNDQIEAMKLSLFVGGRNIMNVLNNFTIHNANQ